MLGPRLWQYASGSLTHSQLRGRGPCIMGKRALRVVLALAALLPHVSTELAELGACYDVSTNQATCARLDEPSNMRFQRELVP